MTGTTLAETKTKTEMSFGPFRLDAPNARLLRGGRPVALTPKAFDVLHHLATRPQRLVTKEELLAAVWPDVIVCDASIKVCVREIRKALDDDPKTPTYIETVHRRGYRFIADVEGEQAEPEPGTAADETSEEPDFAPARAPGILVGRDEQVARLTASFRLAQAGRRQFVLVSGGPGSGKTALAEAFVQQVPGATVLAGHCFQQFGTGEPYMPVWEALGRLSKTRPSPVLAALLARHADARAGGSPSAAAPHHRGTSDRLLRELADGIEALAAEAPVVLLLEDVHWADYSTIDLLSALARRRSPARILVVATYRPDEIDAADHPLRGVVQGLLAGGLCAEVPLDFLDEPAVAQFLRERFPGSTFPPALPRRLHQRTEGHPLFLVHLVDDLVEQGVVTGQDGTWRLAGAATDDQGEPGDVEGSAWLAVLETQIPQSVRAMIGLQLQRLDPAARQALEAAAVAGVEFSAASVAAALSADVVRAEQACDDLARRHRFLQPAGVAEWPDGTAATHYRFVHELYHNVVYEQVPAARRGRMHQLVALAVEAAWDGRAAEEAAGLAMHFEAGRDWPRAAKYLRLAAHSAARHYAHREAAQYLRRALSALDRLPEAARAEHELDVLQHLAVNLQVTRGFAAHDVEAVHARSHALCRASGDVRRTFPVLWGIWVFNKVRSDLHKARQMADELLAMAEASGDAGLLLQAHQAMCVTHLCLGAPAVTRDHMERAAALYDAALHAGNTLTFGQDPGVATQAFGSVALWLLGRPEEALAASERSLALAHRLDQPSSLAVALHFATMLHQLRGDVELTAHLSQKAIELASDQGFSFWLAGGQVFRGWARAVAANTEDDAEADAGIAEMRRGLDAWLATGSRTYHTYYLGLLADALQRHGRHDEALPVLDEALAAAQLLPEGLYEAELHRLKGAGIMADADDPTDPDARDSLGKALITARAQGAAWFERRATLDLRSAAAPRRPAIRRAAAISR